MTEDFVDLDQIDKEERDRSRSAWREKKSKQLRDRLLFVLDDLAPARGKYSYLESRTGIPAARWQNLYLEKQYPTLDMIWAISEYRRYYLSWLMTGANPEFGAGSSLGQMSPPSEQWEKFQEHRDWVRTAKKKNGNQAG